MGLLETLAVGVGVGVAKGILKVWFKEEPISAGIGNGLIDIIKSKTDDQIAQRSAEKQLDQVAKRVAQSIEESINRKFPEITDDRKRFIAAAAGASINSTEFSAELLVKANLSPDDLLNFFLNKSGSEGGHPSLSGMGSSPAPLEEQELYRSVLSEASQLIVDIASQYPKYTDAVFSELLVGQDEHVRMAELILTEVTRIRAGLTGDTAKSTEFNETYRRAVVRRLDELQLFGVDLSASTKRYKLSTAYVSLVVEAGLADSDNLSESDINGDDDDSHATIKVEQALAQTPRLFIRGGPGSGKTTLLQWLAVMSAARNLPHELEAWNNFVPFFIRLRDFAQDALPSPDTFANLISETLESAPAGWVRSLLKSGHAIVLIDGIDELPAVRKDGVRKWLADLTTEFGEARYIVSSRPHAAEEGWLEPVGFMDAELQEMSSSDIDSFIEHWHDAAREGLKDESAVQQLDELEVALKRRIRRSAPIYKLASTPLLCAVICALHRDRMQNIPEDRIELYEACIDMFLRRDHERRIEFPDLPVLNSRQVVAVLSDLAYWYIRNTISLADAHDVDERIQRQLRDFKAISAMADGTSVREGLVARSGILREPSAGKIDFPHRTFQEFLAAKRIVDERDFGVLVNRAHEQQNWRETIILSAGLANKREAESLISELVAIFDREKDAGLLFLAVGCLETIVSLADPVRRIVEERLESLLPPKSLPEGKQLVSAGDLVVPFLSHEKTTNRKEAAACVRALTVIGTDLAHEVLDEYVQCESRLYVWREIVRSSSYSKDRSEFNRRYLQRVVKVSEGAKPQHRYVSNGLNWEIQDVGSVYLRDDQERVNLSALRGLDNLVGVDLRRRPVESKDALLELPSVRHVTTTEPLPDDVAEQLRSRGVTLKEWHGRV